MSYPRWALLEIEQALQPMEDPMEMTTKQRVCMRIGKCGDMSRGNHLAIVERLSASCSSGRSLRASEASA